MNAVGKPSSFECWAVCRRGGRAFTLVEVLITLGVISISLVGILALFPVALKTSLESRNETRYALIAQTIFSDLRTGGFTAARLVTGPNSATDFTTVDLSTPGQSYVLFSANGTAIRALSRAEFEAAIADPEGQFVALVDVKPLEPVAKKLFSPEEPSKLRRLSKISLHLADPSTLPHSQRTPYPFVSIIWETQP